jgi:hypothetical protein
MFDMPLANPPPGMSNTQWIGSQLYTRYLFVFQAAGLVLLTSMIGAIVLTHRQRVKRHKTARDIADAGQRDHIRPNAVRQGAAGCRPGGRTVIGLAHYLAVSAALFVLGVLGIFINRKNVIIILMSIELILLAVNINFVAFLGVPERHARPDFRDVRADGGGRRGGNRPCHPGDLFPQPRHDRG